MRNRIWMPVVGFILALVFELTILRLAGIPETYSFTSYDGFNGDHCPLLHEVVSTIAIPEHVLTTLDTAVIIFTLTGSGDEVCNHRLTLSGGSPDLMIAPMLTQEVTLYPGETIVVSWRLSTPNPSFETVKIHYHSTELTVRFKFIPAYFGLTAAQIFLGLHAGLLLGVALIVQWFRDP